MDRYIELSEYYKKIFSEIDHFLFNSSVSESVYCEQLRGIEGSVHPVILSTINDRRKRKTFDSKRIRLTFIGNTTPYKGYPLLQETLFNLLAENISNWSLAVWGGAKNRYSESPNISFKGKYNSSELEAIYDDTDLLIVPSICKETFSLITLEALSYGVPVLVSSTVGAQDIIKKYEDIFIYKDKDDLKCKLKLFLSTPSLLAQFNSKILSTPWVYDPENHARQIHLIYEQLRSKKQ